MIRSESADRPVVTPSIRELERRVGEEVAVSPWLDVGQERIDTFAKAIEDFQWIHVDRERAAREMPHGRTIAHGLFVLSLVPALQRGIWRVERRGVGLNYGSDRVRYTAPVPVGSRVRLQQTLVAAERIGAATRLTTRCEFELEGSPRPALVADFILLLHDG